jgi:hypothetical protein
MKKSLIAGLFATLLFSAFSAENLLENGGFEEVSQVPKATDKYLMEQIKNGWNVGSGPLAEMPSGWSPNGGTVKFRIITVGENSENKENVHSGKHSAYFQLGNIFCQFPNKNAFKPGKYELNFWYKGTGQIGFSCYCYGIDPATGMPQKHLGSPRFCQFALDNPEKWKEFRQTYELGVPGTVYFILAFCGANGECYLDDVCLTAVE